MPPLPLPPPARSDVELIAANAFSHQAHSSTFRLIDKTDPTCGGTVVAVNIGSRFFLATAKHLIQKSHELTVVLRNSVVESVSQFAARHVHPDADVGLLELHASDVRHFGDNFVMPERFLLSLNQQGENAVTVIGYPGELISDLGTREIAENESVKLSTCSAFTFHTVALQRDEWPTSGTLTEPIWGRDIFLSFDPESTVRFLYPGGAGEPPPTIDRKRPHPAGISGGGIWVMRRATDIAVWQPRALLCGIQFGYYEAGGWLRGASLQVWLEIVEKNYPELELKRN